MNNKVAKTGATIVTVTIMLFSFCMIIDFPFASYIVCMFLSIGYIMMTVGFHHESDQNRRVAATTGLAFAIIYAVMILMVYFAQTTSVRLDGLNEQAVQILDYQRGGLLFNYDLLGYGMMALSTFFIGLSMEPDCKADKWLKYLMMVHGVFFISCFIMPMTGVFAKMADREAGSGGTVALLCWCVYFFPVGVLAYRHFDRAENRQ